MSISRWEIESKRHCSRGVAPSLLCSAITGWKGAEQKAYIFWQSFIPLGVHTSRSTHRGHLQDQLAGDDPFRCLSSSILAHGPLISPQEAKPRYCVALLQRCRWGNTTTEEPTSLVTTGRDKEQATPQQPGATTKGTWYQVKKKNNQPQLTSFDSTAQISLSLFINRGRRRVDGTTMPREVFNSASKGKAPPCSLTWF